MYLENISNENKTFHSRTTLHTIYKITIKTRSFFPVITDKIQSDESSNMEIRKRTCELRRAIRM